MLDALHMLHNAAYIVLFERARLDMRQTLAARYGEEVFDWPFYVARHEIDYIQPIYAPQPVTINIQIRAIGRSSATFEQSMHLESGDTAARCITVLVRVDAETKRPVPWSDRYRERVAEFVMRSE